MLGFSGAIHRMPQATGKSIAHGKKSYFKSTCRVLRHCEDLRIKNKKTSDK